MDPRGFGHSEGKRAYIESEEALLEDQLRFNELIDDKFGGKDVPKLQMGYSMGGLLSLKINARQPAFFKGSALVTPYLDLKDRDTFKTSNMAILKLMDKFVPWFRLPIPAKSRKAVQTSRFLRELNEDPMLEAREIPVRNVLVNEGLIRRFQAKEAE